MNKKSKLPSYIQKLYYTPIDEPRSSMVKNIKNDVKKMDTLGELNLNLGDTSPPTSGQTFPDIQVTTNEKDRTVISFNNKENVIDGIEVIRPDEMNFSLQPEVPGSSSSVGRASIPEIKPPVVPKVIKIDEIQRQEPPKKQEQKQKETRFEPERTSFGFDDISSFMNPIKQKSQSELNKQKEPSIGGSLGGYSSDGSSVISRPQNNTQRPSYASYASSVSAESPRSYHSGESTNEQNKYKQEEQEKHDLLIKLIQLENKGVKLTRSFNMKSPIDDIRFEVQRQQSLIQEEESVKFMRNALITFVHGVEIMNSKFDPIGAKLNGWSNSVMEDIGSYEGIFQRLHEKYRGSVEMAPELELLLTLAQSAFMFHLMETVFKGALPNLGAAISSDPNLVNGLMRATARAVDQRNVPTPPQPSNSMPQGQGGGFGGPSFNLGEMLGPLMGGIMGSMGGMGGQMGGMGGPSVMPMGNNAFRQAMSNPPPQPMQTRDTETSRFMDDSDRFSTVSSTSSTGSEIRSPTIQVTKGKGKGKGKGGKTLFM